MCSNSWTTLILLDGRSIFDWLTAGCAAQMGRFLASVFLEMSLNFTHTHFFIDNSIFHLRLELLPKLELLVFLTNFEAQKLLVRLLDFSKI